MVIYTDGSYDKRIKNACGYAAVIVNFEDQSEYNCTILYGKQSLPDLTSMWNVGGEIWAALTGVDYAHTKIHATEIDLYYDYMGIEMWAIGKWATKKPATASYKRRMQSYMDDMKIRFHKVAAHTGVILNEVADQYAKAGIQLPDNELQIIDHLIIKKGR